LKTFLHACDRCVARFLPTRPPSGVDYLHILPYYCGAPLKNGGAGAATVTIDIAPFIS